MKKFRYVQLSLIVIVFLGVNIFPSDFMEEGSADISLNLYPKAPHNVSFLNTDTTMTLEIQNKGEKSIDFKYWIADESENLLVNGRDGEKLPIQDEIRGSEYLFSVDEAGTSKNLNQGLIPKSLKNRFEEEDHQLYENALVFIESGEKWEISDRNNTYVVIRDDDKLDVYNSKNYYQSFALLPLNHEENTLSLKVILTDAENNLLCTENFFLKILVPKSDPDTIKSVAAMENGISPNAEAFLIPRYRRYWHPERSEIEETPPSYVWLVVDENQNVLVDDETKDIVMKNITIPWKILSVAQKETELWNGSNFKKKYIPVTKIEGDNSHNYEGSELYFAAGENRGMWVSRRILYWTSENLVVGSLDEIPDTERIDLWMSAENGESLFTISDYHHYSFRYEPVGEYTIQTFYHCPLPLDAPLLWSDFTIVNYEAYPLSEMKYDHLGFSEKVHPVDRVLEEKTHLIKRNLIGAALAVLILVVPYAYNRRKTLK